MARFVTLAACLAATALASPLVVTRDTSLVPRQGTTTETVDLGDGSSIAFQVDNPLTPSDGKWKTLSCTTPVLTSGQNDPFAQWDAALAPDAWNDAMIAYEDDNRRSSEKLPLRNT